MYVALPFPKCKSCGESSNRGYHHNCGGALEINPEIEIVHCPKCDKTWNIWESIYECSCCGETFTSYDITESVREMLFICKMCMKEIQKQQEAQKQRKSLGEESLRSFVKGICEGLGYVVGVAIETVIYTLAKLLFKN